jgi:hypothetical protein
VPQLEQYPHHRGPLDVVGLGEGRPPAAGTNVPDNGLDSMVTMVPVWGGRAAPHAKAVISANPAYGFISRLAERALPSFKFLWMSEPFVWTQEADEALQELKLYQMSLPVVVAPEPDEPLLLYVVATAAVVSMVLVAERPKLHQPPAAGSRSQNSDPAEGPGHKEATGS